MQGCTHFPFEAHLSSTLNYGTDRIASDTPITVPIKHAPRVRFVVAFPPKRQMSTSGLETDNRTAAECNVTLFIIARNAIITGKLDERISQMSTMLMRYVFMDILTRYGKGFRRSNSTVKRTLVKLRLISREILYVSTYLYIYLFIYSKFLKYE